MISLKESFHVSVVPVALCDAGRWWQSSNNKAVIKKKNGNCNNISQIVIHQTIP